MVVRMMVAGVLAGVVLAVCAPVVEGAVVVPVKGYVKPDEAIAVRFLNEKGDEGKKAVAALGLEATKMEGLFQAGAGGGM